MRTLDYSGDDMIQVDDLSAFLSELEDERYTLLNDRDESELDEDEKDELYEIEEAMDEVSSVVDQIGKYGEMMISDYYFTEYARELAEDICGRNLYEWPFNNIDWDEAAEDLKVDYTSVSYDGTDYWVR